MDKMNRTPTDLFISCNERRKAMIVEKIKNPKGQREILQLWKSIGVRESSYTYTVMSSYELAVLMRKYRDKAMLIRYQKTDRYTNFWLIYAMIGLFYDVQITKENDLILHNRNIYSSESEMVVHPGDVIMFFDLSVRTFTSDHFYHFDDHYRTDTWIQNGIAFIKELTHENSLWSLYKKII